MGTLRHILNPLHQSTTRDYIGRMINDKVTCMEKAKKYDYDYWDGDRATGYGGYRYDGRWAAVANRIIDIFDLKAADTVLDVGCGKGFLLYELTRALSLGRVVGYDISQYAIDNAKPEIKPALSVQRAERAYPETENAFDLAYSITTLHNLKLPDLKSALEEMTRVSKRQYIVVESYRNERELFNLQCWALTCECFFSPEEWQFIFDVFGYKGDFEFIFFE